MSNTLIRDKSFYLNIFTLTFPIMLQQLLRISVNTVNSIMLGGIDQLQMSAVSQACLLYTSIPARAEVEACDLAPLG